MAVHRVDHVGRDPQPVGHRPHAGRVERRLGGRGRRGLVPAAVAADGAGSIRIPAACCGLFGLKPQSGRVPRTPHDAGGSHWVCFGGLTRSVEDAALMLDVMAPGIARGARGRCGSPTPRRSRRSRAASSRGAGALRDTADLLRELGHEVVERDIDSRTRDMPVVVALLIRGIRDIVLEVERPQRLERRTRAIARPGALIPDACASGCCKAERGSPCRVGRLWDDRDVLLMPMLAAPARPGADDGGPRRDRDLAVGKRWVPVRRALELDRPARGVRARGLRHARPPARRPARRRPHGEGTLLALAAEIERARSMGTSSPARLRLLACPAAWRCAGSAQGSSSSECGATVRR